MVNFTIDQIRKIMDKPTNIRNMSVIAHVDHGKSTLTDSLVAKAGLIAERNAGEDRFTDYSEMEKERGITIKSTGVSLYYEYDVDNKGVKEEYLINLIDSPGHVDFSSEVTAALRVTDGALVVVDCVEGVCVQTETVLRQAMQEKIKPVLFVNKIDRLLIELKYDPEDMYQAFVRAIDMVNVIISTYEQPDMGDLTLDPVRGSIGFGSGKECWGFTLREFARMYSKKFNIAEDKLMERLWGDWYFDAEAHKWKTENVSDSGKPLKRSFIVFVLEPIIKIVKTIMEGDEEQIQKVIEKTGVKVTSAERKDNPPGKKLVKLVLSRWINAADAILEMMIHHLPSPKEAQKYRVSYLYEGPQDDPCAMAIRNCDPNGPLMMYVSKMIPTTDFTRFFAFGRVFSGTVRTGQKVRIMGPNYIPGKKDDLYEKSIQRTVLMMGKNIEYIPEIPCGNTAGLVGVDSYIVKNATISTHPEAHTIRAMKYSVSPVVRVAVEPTKPADLPKLIEGLRRLTNADQLVQCTQEEGGQHIIAGSGELHIEICLHDLRTEYANCEIKVSEPIVTYRETITDKSSVVCLAKSSNNLNRVYGAAEPLSQELALAIESGKIGPKQDGKTRIAALVDEFAWDRTDAQKLWCFGPENVGPNVLVDQTKGLAYLREIQDSLETAFQIVTKEGVLCEENLHQFRMNILDATIHNDPVHRGPGQIIEAGRRVCYSSQLCARTRLLEPVFLTEITVPGDAKGGVYQCVMSRRGQIVEEVPVAGTPLFLIKAYLPVGDSFGFAASLRSMTAGQAFPQCVFDHWEEIKTDPLEAGTKANQLMLDIRKRKGLKLSTPQLHDYLDKL